MTDFTEANAIAEDMRGKGIRLISLSYGKQAKNERFVSSMRLLATGPKEYYKLTKAYFNGILREVQKTVCVSEPLSKTLILDKIFTHSMHTRFHH